MNHECPIHHQEMDPRKPGTPEQAFQGDWFQCPVCTSSILVPSEKFKAWLAPLSQPTHPALGL